MRVAHSRFLWPLPIGGPLRRKAIEAEECPSSASSCTAVNKFASRIPDSPGLIPFSLSLASLPNAGHFLGHLKLKVRGSPSMGAYHSRDMVNFKVHLTIYLGCPHDHLGKNNRCHSPCLSVKRCPCSGYRARKDTGKRHTKFSRFDHRSDRHSIAWNDQWRDPKPRTGGYGIRFRGTAHRARQQS